MKVFHLIAIMSLIVISLTSISINSVRAQNLTEDFGEKTVYNLFGDKAFSYSVTATIETESNSGWIVGKSYSIYWTISLTYLNTSIYNSKDFYILFYHPNIVGIQDTIITNETFVSTTQIGTLYAQCAPTEKGNFEIKSDILAVYYYGNNNNQTGYWSQNVPIWITVTDNASDTSVNPLIYAGIGAVIGAVIVIIPTTIYLASKSKKNKLPAMT